MGVIDSIKGAIRERSAGGKAEQEAAVREEIFNDAKFIESLDHNPNVDMDSDLETLQKAREAFKMKDKASADLQKLFKNQLKRDLGVDLDAADMAGVKAEIDTYLQNELVDNPEHITELAESITEFNETQARITEQEKVLAGLGADVDFLKQQRGAIRKVEGSTRFMDRFFVPSKANMEDRQKAEHNFGIDLSKLDEERASIEEKISRGQSAEKELDKLKEGFADLRKEILQDLAPMAALADLARTKARQKLEQLAITDDFNTDTLGGLDKARDLFKRMKGSGADAESGINYVEGNIDEDQFLAELDTRYESAAQREMEQAIDKVAGSKLTLKNMIDGLKPFLARRELGTKESPDTREFLLNHLKTDLLPRLPKSKQILLNVALQRFE